MRKLVLIPLAAVIATALTAAQPLASGVNGIVVDRTIKPGDDFDGYVNGPWRARTTIAADRSSTGVFYDVSQLAERRNRTIIDDAVKARASAGSNQRRIADYYAAFADTARIEQRGLAPLKAELAAIAALKDKGQLSAMLGADLRADVDPLNSTNFSTEHLAGLFVTQALGDPNRTVPYVLQGGLGMPDRDYYLSTKPETVAIRTAYRRYIGQLLKLAGVSDPEARADRIMALELKIATTHADIVTSQDAKRANNPWSRTDFDRKAPGIDWTAFWRAAGLGDQRDFVAWHPEPIARLSALVASEPLQVWQDWLTFHHINTSAAVLPAAIDAAHFDFYGKTLNGTPAQRSRDKRAIAAVNADLGDAVGQLYAARYFPASSRAAIEGMVRNIVAAFDRRIVALDWMAPATKAEARRKLRTLKVGIGYPDRWRDYAGLEIRADDPLGNMRRAELFEYRHQLAKIGKPVDRSEWWMTPQTVNAVNLPLQNALNFPAAILEAPFFDPKADAAANYGSIGAVIGHEISHSFDNLGSTFDAEGRLHDWWTPVDLQRFRSVSAALVAQYSAYEALPGLHLNGEQELGENIADVAGLAAAYEAYHASLGKTPAPLIGRLSGDQRFFLAYARSWRAKSRDQALRSRITTDVHAPDRFRAQTVRNIDGWYPAFAVKPGDKLYLAPSKRVNPW